MKTRKEVKARMTELQAMKAQLEIVLAEKKIAHYNERAKSRAEEEKLRQRKAELLLQMKATFLSFMTEVSRGMLELAEVETKADEFRGYERYSEFEESQAETVEIMKIEAELRPLHDLQYSLPRTDDDDD